MTIDHERARHLDAAAIGAIALAFVAALIIAWQADRSMERGR